MQVDWSVELGADDPVLEVPWATEDRRYHDLRARPELLLEVEEAMREPALGEFLAALNSAASAFATAKCDAWASREITPEEEVFGAGCKFGSYVDFTFVQEGSRFSFEAHETLVQRLSALLQKVPEIAAAVEFIVRRAFFHEREGCYVTAYCFGYGDEDIEAHQRWAIAIKLVENAILQVSAELTH